MKATLFGLYGKSCTGKSTLINEIHARYQIPILLSNTTRPQRHGEDDLHYRFWSWDDFTSAEMNGKFATVVRFAGHKYAFHWDDLRELINPTGEQRVWIRDVTEEGIIQLRGYGVDVVAVQIVSEVSEDVVLPDRLQDPNRQRDDAARPLADAVVPDLTVVHKFTQEGKEKAIDQIVNFINSRIPAFAPS